LPILMIHQGAAPIGDFAFYRITSATCYDMMQRTSQHDFREWTIFSVSFELKNT